MIFLKVKGKNFYLYSGIDLLNKELSLIKVKPLKKIYFKLLKIQQILREVSEFSLIFVFTVTDYKVEHS